ncbi:WD40-repeat-containing domain protein [Cristinia sonorae]|uniref:methylated diphthine methylhydrolase n=1 Tax=Cristinia sonorae TaxID=1940300 RepID=A0A8K0UT89_9AGAR|nr:WD40-repeat-containing domain protein [Cristinia sonorae]
MAAFDTIWPADSIEFCPNDEASNIFVCGTYNLEKSDETISPETDLQEPPRPQKRRGKILLFEVEDAEDSTTLNNIEEVDLPAVLDLKWCHRDSSLPPLLASADSEGGIKLFEYHALERRLVMSQSIVCAEPHVLCLSIDWSNRRTATTGLGSLVVSMSDKNVSVLQFNGSELAVAQTWAAHDFEPWIAAWNYWDTNIVYTGGDDLKMKAWDIREDCTQPIFTNSRFDAGVTTIQSHPFVEHLLAVGSYDNTVRLFDVRKPLRPLVQADVGGGAWRVKWHSSPERKEDLLVASMHDGAKVVRFNHAILGSLPSATQEWEITQRMDKHESMAYGADWSFQGVNGGKDSTLIVSCSFYDHVLYTWRG